MKRLFLLDYFRGTDSTGFAAIRSSGDVKLSKINSHPLDLFEMSRFKEALNGHSSEVFLGHNRSATRGKTSTFNAHPFAFGKIVGAHNGTLSAHTTNLLEEKVGEKFEVDSMAIFANIDQFGLEETIELMRESPVGTCLDAWALVFYNTEERTLNFIRNKERPMWYSYSEDFKKVFWASEWPMIDAAVALSPGADKLYASPPNAEGKSYRFFSMEEDIHYKFDVGELKKGSTERPKPMAKKIAGKGTGPVSVVRTPDPFQRNPVTGDYSRQGSTTIGGQTTHSAPLLPKKKEEGNNVVHLFAEKGDPYGGVIDRARFIDLAKYGCSWCQSDVDYDEVGCTIIDRDDILLCPDCSSLSGKNTNRIYVRDVNLA